MDSNHFSYTGQISFMPMIRNTSNGGQFLPITLKRESSSVSIALFDVLAVTVANGAATGQELSIEGWMTSRKNSKTGYFETNLNGQRLSLDGGKTWYTAEPRPAQQQQQPVQQQSTLHQQIQGFQQPVQNQPQTQQQQQPQASNQSGQTNQPQTQQPQPQQQSQPQQMQQQQAPQQNPAPQQHQAQPASMAEFLNSNPYRQGQPVSQEAAQAQSQLYSAPQQQQQPSQEFGEFDNVDIPF